MASRERGAHGAAVVSARTLFAVVALGATQCKVSVNDMINAERLPVPETTCEFYLPEQPEQPEQNGHNSAENGRISRITCVDQRI